MLRPGNLISSPKPDISKKKNTNANGTRGKYEQAETAKMSTEEITVHIKSSVDKKYDFTVPISTTVGELKDKIAVESEVPAESQRLIYSGRVLKDQDTIEHYKIKSGHTIHLVKSANARTNNASPGATSNNATSSNSTTTPNTSNNTGLPTNLAAGQGAFNPLAGLTDARYAGYGPALPSESMFGPDGGMQLPNEQDLETMMNNPMVMQGMNEMLRNPQMIDYLINSNPQLQQMGPQVREMLQSDYFRQMLSNPQMMRQAREMSRMMGGAAAGGQQNTNSMPAPGRMNDDDNNNNDSTTSETNPQPPRAAGAAGTGAAPNPFGALFGGAGAGAGAGSGAGALPPFDPALLQNLFGGGAAPAPQDDTPPEVKYETQLRQLNDMGFFDFDANVRALRRSGGSVQGAIEHLFSS